MIDDRPAEPTDAAPRGRGTWWRRLSILRRVILVGFGLVLVAMIVTLATGTYSSVIGLVGSLLTFVSFGIYIRDALRTPVPGRDDLDPPAR